MRPGEPSFTAQASAVFRALHAILLPEGALHDDSLALTLVGLAESDAVELFKNTPEFESMCAYFALRHRIAEDRLMEAIERGTRDIVILGAGLDSYPLRRPDVVAGLNYFEVDHPDTQAWKLRRLAELGMSTPGVEYVAVDFDRESIVERLQAHGFGADTAFFTWLGISQYVSHHAAKATFELVANSGPSSEIVFDIIVPDALLDAADQRLNEQISAASAGRGEQWVSRYSPDEVTSLLREQGFRRVTHYSPTDLAATYYKNLLPPIRPLGACRVVHAVGRERSRH